MRLTQTPKCYSAMQVVSQSCSMQHSCPESRAYVAPMHAAGADRKQAQCLSHDADLFRSMLQDLGHFGAHCGHGPLLQLPELACVGASICILGVVADISAPVQTVLLTSAFTN